MKIPQTFVPDKDLEEKIKLLLKKKGNKKKEYIIDMEAEKLFPNFINYLKGKHDMLYISRPPIWTMYAKDSNSNTITFIGVIKKYVKEEGMDLMYGYEADIRIKEVGINLVYRLGYKKPDSKGNVICTNEPARYDTEKIPFP